MYNHPSSAILKTCLLGSVVFRTQVQNWLAKKQKIILLGAQKALQNGGKKKTNHKSPKSKLFTGRLHCWVSKNQLWLLLRERGDLGNQGTDSHE